MKPNASHTSTNWGIILLAALGSLIGIRGQAANFSCVKAQSFKAIVFAEAELESRIEALAKQALYIRWKRFSDSAKMQQAIYYIEAESQKLQELVPDLNQRFNNAIRKIRQSELDKVDRDTDSEKNKKDLIEEAIKRASPEYYRKNAIFHEIQPGKFMMGEVGKQVETEITKPFAMMATQVTQMMYAKLMIAMGESNLKKINPSKFKTGTDSTAVNIDGIDVVMKPDHPVEMVSWNDLMESGGFIEGLNKLSTSNDHNIQNLLQELIPGHKKGDIYDLPTEAQWEFVMRNRGLANKHYFDRDDDADIPNHAWYRGNSKSTEYPFGSTHAVATKQARTIDGKPFFDLEGNVLEWNKDSWDGNSPLLGGKDPLGTTGSYRVFRGGGWYYDAQYLRSGNRGSNSPGYRVNDVGFRLVRTRP